MAKCCSSRLRGARRSKRNKAQTRVQDKEEEDDDPASQRKSRGTELLEMILLQLPADQVPSDKQVSSQFKATIKDSHKLQRLLFTVHPPRLMPGLIWTAETVATFESKFPRKLPWPGELFHADQIVFLGKASSGNSAERVEISPIFADQSLEEQAVDIFKRKLKKIKDRLLHQYSSARVHVEENTRKRINAALPNEPVEVRVNMSVVSGDNARKSKGPPYMLSTITLTLHFIPVTFGRLGYLLRKASKICAQPQWVPQDRFENQFSIL